jgi:hypothetical protein
MAFAGSFSERERADCACRAQHFGAMYSSSRNTSIDMMDYEKHNCFWSRTIIIEHQITTEKGKFIMYSLINPRTRWSDEPVSDAPPSI